MDSKGLLTQIATELRTPPEQLMTESLRLYLEHRLRLVESELLRLAHKYGVQTVAELDRLVQSGKVHEEEAFEDYFEFDYLEAERDKIRELLATLKAA